MIDLVMTIKTSPGSSKRSYPRGVNVSSKFDDTSWFFLLPLDVPELAWPLFAGWDNTPQKLCGMYSDERSSLTLHTKLPLRNPGNFGKGYMCLS